MVSIQPQISFDNFKIVIRRPLPAMKARAQNKRKRKKNPSVNSERVTKNPNSVKL